MLEDYISMELVVFFVALNILMLQWFWKKAGAIYMYYQNSESAYSQLQ